MPFYPFLREESPTKVDYRKKGTLILTSLLEELVLDRFSRNQIGMRHMVVHSPKRIQKSVFLILSPFPQSYNDGPLPQLTTYHVLLSSPGSFLFVGTPRKVIR